MAQSRFTKKPFTTLVSEEGEINYYRITGIAFWKIFEILKLKFVVSALII